MSSWAEEVNPDEVLVGAEAYQRMLDDCDERLKLANSRIDGYDGTRQTLKALLRSCKQDLMVPVAGGLGYFEGTISHTNKVLVLLGENIFAERSVADAVGVADRRIGYLMAERQALELERKDIVDKQNLFIECGVQGSKTDDQVKQQRPPLASAHPTNNRNNDTTIQHRQNNLLPASASSAPLAANSKPDDHQFQYHYANKDNNADANEANQDVDGDEEDGDFDDENEVANLIDPRDELTLDELVALEEELGDDIADEEKAEAAIMDLVNKKKAVRLAREASVFGHQPEAPKTTSSSQHQSPSIVKDPSTSTSKPVHFDPAVAPTPSTSIMAVGGQSHSSAALAFASPADIGRMFSNAGGAFGEQEVRSQNAEVKEDNKATATQTSSTSKETPLQKEVKYATNTHHDAMSVAATRKPSGPVQQEVVEKNIPNAFVGPAHTTSSSASVGVIPKKRSLFGKEMGLK